MFVARWYWTVMKLNLVSLQKNAAKKRAFSNVAFQGDNNKHFNIKMKMLIVLF